jgi:putative ABC transport system permease protein
MSGNKTSPGRSSSLNFRWLLLMAWRDSRRNRSRLFLFISSIILGITALVAIYSFEDNLRQDIDNQAKTLLGADLLIETNKAVKEEAYPLLDSLGKDRSEERTFASMVLFPKSQGTRLVNVRDQPPLCGQHFSRWAAGYSRQNTNASV